MNYFEHHIGDYDEATSHLSGCQDGMYSRLIRKYYATEKPLINDITKLQRLIRAKAKDEKQAVVDVLEEFFELRADGFHNDRCDAEIARFQDKQRKAKASADARWAHTERNANASPNAMRTHSEGNATHALTPAPADARSSLQSPDTSLQTPEHPPASRVPPPRGSRLPADWAPSDGELADAREIGVANGRVSLEAARFRDHWISKAGKEGVKTDWRATWRNWCRKAIEMSPKTGPIASTDAAESLFARSGR